MTNYHFLHLHMLQKKKKSNILKLSGDSATELETAPLLHLTERRLCSCLPSPCRVRNINKHPQSPLPYLCYRDLSHLILSNVLIYYIDNIT